MDIWQGVSLFKGLVIRTNGPFFCNEFGMGWCDFPVDCGNSIEVRNSTGLSGPRFREALG